VYMRSFRRESAVQWLSERELEAEQARAQARDSAASSTAQRVAQRGDKVTSWIADRARANLQRDRDAEQVDKARLLEQGEAVGAALGSTVSSVRSAVRSIVAGYAAGKAGTSRAPWLDYFAKEFDQADGPRASEAERTAPTPAAAPREVVREEEQQATADERSVDADRPREAIRGQTPRGDPCKPRTT